MPRSKVPATRLDQRSRRFDEAMRPVRFEYHQAETVEDALEKLSALGDEASVIAGGYSLVPMMNLRLARPSYLVDINRLSLTNVTLDGEILRIGALVRHHQLLTDDQIARQVPLLREAGGYIAHPAIRNRGSLGGSLAHADPTAEIPLVAVTLDAQVLARSSSGERKIEASEFFRGAYSTALAPDELVVGIELPIIAEDEGSVFLEHSERRGDFAIAAVAVSLKLSNGKVQHARIGCSGMGSAPFRASEAEKCLLGEPVSALPSRSAGDLAAQNTDAHSDLRAGADYRKHLLGELVARAVDCTAKQIREAGR